MQNLASALWYGDKVVLLIQDKGKILEMKRRHWLTKLYTLYHIQYNLGRNSTFVEHSQEI